MAKKKAAKSASTDKKKAPKADTTVVLYLPEPLWSTYTGLSHDEKTRVLRDIYHLINPSDTKVWGMDHCLVRKKTNVNTKAEVHLGRHHGKDPKKVCDGP